MKTGIDFQIEEPEKLGADRIAAAAGACGLFGAPVAVIDFGTATTLNFIGNGNKYKGGAIMPGLELMRKSLFSDTAQLPDVTVFKPMSPLGKDTVECIPFRHCIRNSRGSGKDYIRDRKAGSGKL